MQPEYVILGLNMYIKMKWEVKKYSLKQMKLVNNLHQLGLSTQERDKYFVLLINNSECSAHSVSGAEFM